MSLSVDFDVLEVVSQWRSVFELLRSIVAIGVGQVDDEVEVGAGREEVGRIPTGQP